MLGWKQLFKKLTSKSHGGHGLQRALPDYPDHFLRNPAATREKTSHCLRKRRKMKKELGNWKTDASAVQAAAPRASVAVARRPRAAVQQRVPSQVSLLS